MNESALIELQSSPIQLESSPIQTESSPIRLELSICVRLEGALVHVLRKIIYNNFISHNSYLPSSS